MKIYLIVLLLITSHHLYSQDYEKYQFKDINDDMFKTRDYNPTNLYTEDIFKFLFPGNFYKVDFDFLKLESYNVSCWKSASSTIKDFSYDNSRDNATIFPLNENCTFLTNKYSFINTEGNFTFFFFSTNDNGEFTGRFNGGYFGIAKFKNQKDYYSLEFFDPAVDCIGNWNFAPQPKEIIDLGYGNYGIVYDEIGEGMAIEEYNPIYGYLRIYSEVNGKVSLIFLDNKAKCLDPWEKIGTEWKTIVNVLETNSSNNFNDIELITDGYYDIEYHPEEMTDFDFPELSKEFKTGRSFYFKITKVYRFDSDKYSLYEKSIQIY